MSVGGFSAIIVVIALLGVVAGFVGIGVAAVVTKKHLKKRVMPLEDLEDQETHPMEETVDP